MFLITHSGRFHGDDVLSTVILSRLYPEAQILRLRDQDRIEARDRQDIVFDVGRAYDPGARIFDHHQAGRPLRPEGAPGTGYPYSSFGLIWAEFGHEYLRRLGVAPDRLEAVHRLFDERIVLPIDIFDNGAKDPAGLEEARWSTLGMMIERFNPVFESSGAGFEPASAESQMIAFSRACGSVGPMIEASVISIDAEVRAGLEVLESLKTQESPEILVLEKDLPFDILSSATQAREVLFVIKPSSSAGWGICIVPTEPGGFSARCDLPASWAGLTGVALERESGIEGAVFCHLGRFYAAAQTRGAAISLARRAIDLTRAPEEMPSP